MMTMAKTIPVVNGGNEGDVGNIIKPNCRRFIMKHI
jgi:hypothetical protein